MQTSLSNRRINKFLWNQPAVDLSRMSTRVTEKNTECTDTLRLNRLGDCPEKDMKKMRKAVTLKRRFAESLSMLHFLHLKSNWPKTLTDSSLTKKSNNNSSSKCSSILQESRMTLIIEADVVESSNSLISEK